MMSIGDGCLKPLNRTYGADQYKRTEVKSIAMFFVLYYFVYNCGSIASRFISPILRQDVKCFGNDDCFTWAFGIPGICMILVAVLTGIANRYSETTKSSSKGSEITLQANETSLQANETTLLNMFACIWVKLHTSQSYQFTNLFRCIACSRHKNNKIPKYF